MVMLLVAAAGVAGNLHDDAVGAGMASWGSGCPEGWISVDHLGCLNFRVDVVCFFRNFEHFWVPQTFTDRPGVTSQT